MNNNEKFEYTYTALSEKERQEVLSIKDNYAPTPHKKETKLERLRKLDNKVTNNATIIALILSIPGVLIFGTGITMVLEWNLLVGGIFVMLIGLVPMAINPIIVSRATTYLKDKYKEDILRISEELLNNKG